MKIVGTQMAVGDVLRQVCTSVLILLSGAVITSCGSDPSTVPVELRSGNGETKSMKPLETSLYEYVDDPRQRRAFKIKTNVPPLKFAFPAAYYESAANLKGGPQANITLQIDPITYQPSNSLNLIPNTGKQFTKRQNDEFLLRNMAVVIYSNILGHPSSVRRDDTTFPIERATALISKRRLPNLDGRAKNFHMIAYDELQTGKLAERESYKFGSVDLYAAGYIGYPDPYGSSKVKMIECIGWSRVCSISIFYHGRDVLIYPEKDQMGKMEEIVDNVIKVLDRYNLDLPKRR